MEAKKELRREIETPFVIAMALKEGLDPPRVSPPSLCRRANDEGFQIFRSSWMHAWSQRICLSMLTSSEYSQRIMPLKMTR